MTKGQVHREIHDQLNRNGTPQIASQRFRVGSNRRYFIMPTSADQNLSGRQYIVYRLDDIRGDPTRGFMLGNTSYVGATQAGNPSRSLKNFLTRYTEKRFIDGDGTGTSIDLIDFDDLSGGSSFEHDGYIVEWNSFPPGTTVNGMLEWRRKLVVSNKVCRLLSILIQIEQFLTSVGALLQTFLVSGYQNSSRCKCNSPK